MKKIFTHLFIRLLLGISILTFSAPFKQQTVLAGTLDGTIAYVVPNTPNGDEIHLIEPDGSGERLLFRTNNPLPEVLSDIGSLAWKPDASELAFISAHEYTCSLYETDVYAIRPDGENYRRVTSPPACGAHAGIPTGTVTVPVFNGTDYVGPFLIYMEGAPAAKSIALPTGGGPVMITFENVADYGPQEQYAVFITKDGRASYAGAHVNVVPGATVQTGPLVITAGFPDWGFRWPTYLPDGSRIATIFGQQTLYEFDPNSQALGWNAADQVQFDFGLWGSALVWAPTPGLEDYFLYYGGIDDIQYVVRESVFLGNAKTGERQELFNVDPNQEGNVLLGLAWLPDGSGFLYSLAQFIYVDEYTWFQGANLWEYNFDSGQSTRLTDVSQGFTRQMAVSPDGSKIVFEYQSSGNWIDPNPPMDLWMMNRDGSGQTLFVENGRNPAWSPTPIPENKPVPVLSGINPSSVNAGGAGFTLTASGSDFVNGSVVRWNGAALTTTYVNATTLTAQVTADKIAAAGTASVTVYTPGPGGGESGAKTFTINGSVPTNPVPVLTTLNPSVVSAGGSDFILTVNGSQFVNASVVRWGGVNLPTTYVNATTLTAQVTAARIASTGPVSVTVFNPTPGGGESEALTLSIINPEPLLSGLNPSFAKVGGAGFTLTVNGSKFISESVVSWNGTDLATTYVSSTRLTAQVTMAQIASAGTAAVTVYNPAPGGGESQPLTLTISKELHTIYLPAILR